MTFLSPAEQQQDATMWTNVHPPDTPPEEEEDMAWSPWSASPNHPSDLTTTINESSVAPPPDTPIIINPPDTPIDNPPPDAPIDNPTDTPINNPPDTPIINPPPDTPIDDEVAVLPEFTLLELKRERHTRKLEMMQAEGKVMNRTARFTVNIKKADTHLEEAKAKTEEARAKALKSKCAEGISHLALGKAFSPGTSKVLGLGLYATMTGDGSVLPSISENVPANNIPDSANAPARGTNSRVRNASATATNHILDSTNTPARGTNSPVLAAHTRGANATVGVGRARSVLPSRTEERAGGADDDYFPLECLPGPRMGTRQSAALGSTTPTTLYMVTFLRMY